MKLASKYLLPGAAAVLVASLAACGGSGTGNAVVTSEATVDTTAGLVIDGETIADKDTFEKAKTQTLNLYTGYQEDNQQVFLDAFTKDTGIKVSMMRLVPNKLSERVLSEHGAGKLPADVIITSDYQLAHGYTEAGIWREFTPETVKDQKDLFLDDGQFVQVLNTPVTFGYNTQLVKEEDAPKSWKDLLDEKYKGKIGIVDGGAGGSVAAMNRFIAEEVGGDYWKDLAALDPVIYESGGTRQTALARGEILVATAGTAAINVAVTQDKAPLNYVVPEEGLITFDFYMGLTKTGASPEAAQVFANYSMSKRGQAVYAAVGDYSVRSDVAPPKALGRELPPLDSAQVWRMPAESAKFSEADAEAWNQAFSRR